MLKKIATLYIAIIFALAIFPNGQQAEAATTTYTFVKANYNDTKDKKGNVIGTKLYSITVKKANNQTATFVLDTSAKYYINSTLTTIEGFKAGMEVTLKIKQNKVIELRSATNSGDGSIVANSKQLTGAVTEIDPNGLYIKVKVDGSSTKTFNVNRNTELFKGSASVDLSTLYVGDRVRMKFASTTTSMISELTIINTSAIMVENLYKATLSTVNTTKNTFNVFNSHPLTDWKFGNADTAKISAFKFTNSTTIYVGNKKITKAQLKNYKNSSMYFTTTKQYSQEVVNKMIVLKNNEFFYYHPISNVNTLVNRIELPNKLKLEYHAGSILIRNGRLVEPAGLVAMNPNPIPIPATAFVITDGATKDDYAHVVNITNDGLLAPNLSSYQLYFGRIDVTDMDAYKVELTDLNKFTNNFWVADNSTTEFRFSNTTAATELIDGQVSKVIPETDLDIYDSYSEFDNPYGYFYVKNGHIQGIHFIGDEPRASLTISGRIKEKLSNKIVIENSSQWSNDGHWQFRFGAVTINLEKAMIVKNGRVIKMTDLKAKDHVIAITKSNNGAQVLIVTE